MRTILLAASTLSASVTALRDDSRVARVDADRVRTAEAVTSTDGAASQPSDPSYGDQWSLPKIGWNQVQGVISPSGTAVVAVLDSGVDASHPELAGAIVPGASILQGSTWWADPNGHGTAMAGIVAAATDNGQGIAGVAYAGVKVMPVTVLGADGTGQDSDVIAGVIWATDHGADVILMAFSSHSYSASLQAALDYAWSNGVVLVAAAGNDGSSAGAFPAGDRGVVGVSNTTRADTLAAGSNSGPSVFLGAPGVGILTTDAGGGYRFISGTSASAAIVAGAAAELHAIDPSASNGSVVGHLARTADPAGTVNETGNGRVNLARAIGDQRTDSVKPEGAGPFGDGGPFVGPYRAAAARTWTGGGADNNWSTPGNWGGTVPVAGDDLVFPGGAARLSNTNDSGRGYQLQLDHDLGQRLYPGRERHCARCRGSCGERRGRNEHDQPGHVVCRDGHDHGHRCRGHAHVERCDQRCGRPDQQWRRHAHPQRRQHVHGRDDDQRGGPPRTDQHRPRHGRGSDDRRQRRGAGRGRDGPRDRRAAHAQRVRESPGPGPCATSPTATPGRGRSPWPRPAPSDRPPGR